MDTVDEIDNSLFVVLLVQSLPDIVDRFTENGRESDTHGSLDVSVFIGSPMGRWTYVGEGVLMVSSVYGLVGVGFMGGDAYMRAKEAGLGYQQRFWVQRGCCLLGLTREGVRGYCFPVSLYF